MQSKLKYISLIGIILILSLANYIGSYKAEVRNEDIIIDGFEKTEAKFENIKINYIGNISEKFINVVEMESINGEVKRILKLNQIEKKIIDEGDMKQLTVYGKDDTGKLITIIINTYKDIDTKKAETGLFVDVEEYNSYKNVQEITSKMKYIFKKYDSKVEITGCIVGAFSGQLEDKSKLVKAMKILEATDSKEVESLVDPSMLSISAYSKYIDRHIFTGDRKMNLNIAMTYDEFEDKTYVLIGSPIIATGY